MEELLSAYGLSAEEIAHLRAAARGISAHELVDAFYTWLQTRPEYPVHFQEDSRLQSVKARQRNYWRNFLDAERDQAYADACAQVGQVHARIGLGIHIYCASMSFCAGWIIEQLGARVSAPAQQLRLARTVEKLCDLDSAIAVDAIATEQARIITIQDATLLELSTPVIKVWAGIVLMPLIGEIDDRRANHLMEALLTAIERTNAQVGIIDITGVSRLDEFVARYLVQSARAAQLLGTEILFTGLRPNTVQALVKTGAESLSDIATTRTLQAGLRHAIQMVSESV